VQVLCDDGVANLNCSTAGGATKSRGVRKTWSWGESADAAQETARARAFYEGGNGGLPLHLIVPQRFFTHGQNPQGDRHVYASWTRFIPNGLLGLFEQTAWPKIAPQAATRPLSREVRIDVGARMRGMWR
jgi:hypothetical protein